MTLFYASFTHDIVGQVMLATHGHGLAFLGIGGVVPLSPQRLSEYFPNEDCVESREAVQPFRFAVTRWLLGEDCEIKLDLYGTPFQQRVWQELKRIPRGQVISYTQLAERIGRPQAVRAAASACAANPVSLFVPCHRVLRSDGALGGYAWGLLMKQALLRAEMPPRQAVAA